MTLKAIYRGPPHYWHTYSLTPRDRFYYGYYGMYGPQVHLKDYEIIEDDKPNSKQVEQFGCECVDDDHHYSFDLTKILLWIVIIVALMMIYVK